ncbi:RNA-processing protein [Sulfolobus sp. E5-1-F]|uniref:KH domain-containing protein n=1 Tax=Sulfolobaceae TaxID=118883 RepID=UPI0012974FE7|nr:MULTISPECIES: KH domain-containing protein [unclassified Sulfolobus]QGA53521.1 RNA-processing protein [Sulfolobus sp. E5-1-F]QGA68811.1 RNA-processing protein [Sulfolobus sp. E11-6]
MIILFITVEDERLEVVRKIIEKLEQFTDTKIIYDERTKTFNILPKGQNQYDALKAASVIRAIGLGFDEQSAFRLLSDEYILDEIDLKALIGSNPEAIRRVKGRIIGEGGKAKRIIQEYTGVDISIYEHYIGIIGPYDQVQVARKAIELLIDGKEHSSVYKFLDKAERNLMMYKISRLGRKEINEIKSNR